MKNVSKILLFICLISPFVSVFSQKKGEVIRLKLYSKVLGSENLSGDDKDTVQYLEPHFLYRVNKVSDSSVVLKAINFNETTIRAKQYNNKLYTVSQKNLEEAYEVYKPKERLSVGLLTLPFKARPQDKFSFDTEFNLNTTLNFYLFRVYNSSFNLQIGTGIGDMNLNPSNSEIEEKKSQNVSTLSLFGGAMISYKKVQAGLYIGVDHINNQAQYQWKHNGNLWFGFGVGFNVFKISIGEKLENKSYNK